MSAVLSPGDTVPDLSLPLTGGEVLTPDALKGRWTVLYFYPKDDTSGCTKEAIAFTELAEAFAEAGAVVIGISKNTLAEHDKFIAKHELGVKLGSDADGDLVERFGFWVEKSMYGRKYWGIERATVLIDPEGQVAEVWRKVRVTGHAEAVLKALRAKIAAREG
ncbi:MAG: peroxiredoxin [Maricaulaceae bacterium]